METSWTEKYWDYMTTENFDDGIALKNLNFPESFFKYKPLSEQTIESISEEYIWLSEIEKLNDPFECSIQFDNDKCLREYYASEKFQEFFIKLTGQKLTKNEIKILSGSEKPFKEYITICRNRNLAVGWTEEEQLNQAQNRWTQIVTETNKNLRICSFSLQNNSLLLWSHYATKHKGICIEYDFIDSEIIRAFIQPILYRDKVYKIGLFEEYTTMQMIGSSLMKSKDWSYENEWRVTIFKQQNKFPQKLKSPIPKAIYLGTRFYQNKDYLKDSLLKIASIKKIPIIQMRKDNNEFKLIY